MRRRRLVKRRNAHQPGNGEPVAVAARCQECIGLLWQHASLLRLGAGIDFGEEERTPPLLGDLLAERLGEARPIERMDRIEQAHRLLGLVRLQRTDEMQFDAGMPGEQRRPFRCSLLHAVLAEYTLTGRDYRFDCVRGERLGDGYQRSLTGSRPASRQARAIAARTVEIPSG